MVGEEKRHQMMQNLFGDQSEEEEEEEEEEPEEEEEEEEEEVGSHHHQQQQSIRRAVDYQSDEGEGGADVVEQVEGQGEADNASEEEEPQDINHEPEESEGERVQSSQERDGSEQILESDGKEADSDDQGYVQRGINSRRRGMVASGSEKSEEHHLIENEDEEVEQDVIQRENDASIPEAEMRDVFGDSDEEPAGYEADKNDLHRSSADPEESDHMNLGPEDMVPEEGEQLASEDENLDSKPKDRPLGPPLNLDVPLLPPPARPDKMNLIRVSNIMGIEPKPFDPETYVEEDVFVADESGAKKAIRLRDNIVRWRAVQNPDGTMSYESNARIIKWSDGSMQLLIGNEVLDISVQDTRNDQMHLFLRHEKGILQSQGRLLQKMRFMPSSLSSKSHKLLTALVDSRHKKVYKVKNCVTSMDPEKEKEEKEKAVDMTIRSREDLIRKQEKIARKYSQPKERGPRLSPGYLEGALEEDDEVEDYHSSRRSTSRRFDDELQGQAERRILNAKKKQVPRAGSQKASTFSARAASRHIEASESEREESEYESEDEDDRMPSHSRQMREAVDEDEAEYEEEDEDVEREEEAHEEEEKEERHPRRAGEALEEEDEELDERRIAGLGRGNRGDGSDAEEHPPKKVPRRRIIESSDEE